MGWTTTADLRAQVKRWWERGEILASVASGQSIFPRRLKLKEPTSSEMTEQFAAVRSWAGELLQVPNCRLEMREFKHRVFGKNSLPSEIWIDTLDDALTLIGKRREAGRFMKLLEITKQREPSLLAWMVKRPLHALELHDCWESILSVVAWLKEHPCPGIYIRQADIAGVDSKFIETHRGVLSELLDLALSPESVDKSVTGAGQFARRYGFKEKPLRIRFRILDAAKQIVAGDCLQDVTLDRESFSSLKPAISQVFITENEINFLSFGHLENSMVIFGGGYGIDELWCANWLMNCRIHYWGDIDTYGFAILSAARNHFPHIRSLLMDEQTLLTHIKLCVPEASQNAAQELPNLCLDEQRVYRNLKQHTWGQSVRLEQERIGWGYAWQAINLSLLQ